MQRVSSSGVDFFVVELADLTEMVEILEESRVRTRCSCHVQQRPSFGVARVQIHAHLGADAQHEHVSGSSCLMQ